MDWLHCNKCLKGPASGATSCRYNLTECGHVACQECVVGSVVAGCPVCGAKGVKLLPVGPKMSPDLQALFQDPSVHLKAVVTAHSFQEDHSKRLIQLSAEKSAKVEAEAAALTKERDKLRTRCQQLVQEVDDLLAKRDDLQSEVALAEEEDVKQTFGHAAGDVVDRRQGRARLDSTYDLTGLIEQGKDGSPTFKGPNVFSPDNSPVRSGAGVTNGAAGWSKWTDWMGLGGIGGGTR